MCLPSVEKRKIKNSLDCNVQKWQFLLVGLYINEQKTVLLRYKCKKKAKTRTCTEKLACNR